MGRLIIDGNRVYELDEACLQKKCKGGQLPEAERKMQLQKERDQRMQNRQRP